jgi:hypothetical protein
MIITDKAACKTKGTSRADQLKELIGDGEPDLKTLYRKQKIKGT